MQQPAMFVFRHGERMQKAKSEGVVAIGWHALTSLDGTWEEMKARLSEAYPELYQGNSRSVGNAAGSIWRFARDMKEGDLVLIPFEGAFYVAEIIGCHAREERWMEDDMAWHRRAKWRKEPFRRLDVGNALQMRLKSRQTIVDASDCIADVLALMSGRTPPKLHSAMQSEMRAIVVETLRTRANSDQLEQIVAGIFLAQGAVSSKVQPKNSGKPGDFDVIAEWPGVGLVPGLRVAAQVKHHVGVSGVDGIEQLAGRMRHDRSVDRLVFITTAEGVSEEANKRADEEGITVLTQNDLADWILSVGLNALRDAD